MGRFRFLTAGESHGQGLVAIAEGMVADLSLDAAYINRELRRRQQGYGRGARMKIEDDKAEILAGVRYGLTTGGPIALFMVNRDWQNWQQTMSVGPVEEEAGPVTRPRPGHADLAGVTKYGLKDIRPVMERASARETAARVAVGAIARRFLDEFGVAIHSHTLAVGPVGSSPASTGHAERSEESHPAPGEVHEEAAIDWQQVEASPVRCADAGLAKAMMAAIDEAKAAGDSLGGVLEVVATGVPVGLGSHVSWDRRLDGRVGRAMMSINAVKGVEIGAGFALAGLRGSQAHDIIEPSGLVITSEAKQPLPWRHATNQAGGIEGGMSNGEDIVVKAAVKPIATLANPLPSMDLRSGDRATAHQERSDVCAVPAAGVIAEAMLAIVLADAVLEKFGGDNLRESLANYGNYLRSIC
jgi:chorismate synthase